MPTISGMVYDETGTAVANRMVRAFRRDTGALLGYAISASSPLGQYSITTSYTGECDVVCYAGAMPDGDVNYSSVSLLLHLDGANNSTAFTDSSSNVKTITYAGAAKLSTATSKFGGSSLLLDGSGSYLTTAANADFALGSGDFTVEAFVKTTATGERVIVDLYTSGGWQLTVYGGKLSWYDTTRALVGSINVNDGAWHHVVVQRSSATLKFFVDGATDGSVASSTNYTATGALSIGAQVASRNATYDFIGNIDEVRITRGVARYSSAFTAPTAAFPSAGLLPGTGTGLNDLILRTTPV